MRQLGARCTRLVHRPLVTRAGERRHGVIPGLLAAERRKCGAGHLHEAQARTLDVWGAQSCRLPRPYTALAALPLCCLSGECGIADHSQEVLYRSQLGTSGIA